MVSYFEARQVGTSDQPGELPAWVREVLPASKSARILDAGCGRGGFLQLVRELGYGNLSGVDGDEAAVVHCREKGLDVREYDISEWRPADFSDLDFVFMSHVLEHMPKDRIIPVLAGILGSLGPNGKLCVAVPNAQSNTGAYWAFEDFTHNWLFTSGSLYYVARMAGFGAVEFVDVDCNAGVRLPVRLVRKALMALYRANFAFWNKVTRSNFHNQSEQIFSFEIKALLSR